MMRIALLLLSLTILAGLLAHALAVARFQKRTAAMIARLQAGNSGSEAMAEVPDVVQSLASGAARGGPGPVWVRLHQRAEMRFKPGDRWRALDAVQVIAVREPGFVWCARMPLALGLDVRVVDAFVDGRGVLEARLQGSLPLVRASGPDTDRAELMRYLAELAWVPEALLHNPALRWRPLDNRRLEVSATTAGGLARVRLVLEGGDIVGAEADDRPRDEGGRMVARPWCGRFYDYRDFGGCRIPRRGEVAWLLEDGPFVYWRGEIVKIEKA